MNKAFLYSLVALMLTGCLRQRKEYSFERITSKHTLSLRSSDERMKVHCIVKKLSVEEEHELFGSRLRDANITPFYLELENNSVDMWYLSARHITAPLASDGLVKDALHVSQAYAWVSSLIALVYCWPLIPVVIMPVAWLTYTHNCETDRFLEDTSMRAHERCFYLAPHERIKKLICVYGWEPGAKFDIALTRDKDGYVTKFTVAV